VTVTPEPHVELRGVVKWFGGVQALVGIDLRIERGHIHGLVGENGAGKSTLGKVVAGALRPDEGDLVVNGRRVSYDSPRDALADGITIISQEPTLVPQRSVLENVFLGMESGRLGLVDQRAMHRRYAALAEEAGIDVPPATLVRDLWVAERQKVEILRSLARGAKLIVMDEPTSALTTREVHRLFDVVRHLRDRGTTIIYISHALKEVLALADTVTVLRDGRLVRTSRASEETPEGLVESMLGRAIGLSFPQKLIPPDDAPVVLSVRNLYGPPIAEPVCFEIRAGEILGLAGLIGSGRSEVARLVFGADRRTYGEIRLERRPVTIRSPRDAIRSGIAMIPEDRKVQGLIMLRSLTENVSLPHLEQVIRAGVLDLGSERRRALELVDRLGIRTSGPLARVNTLSGGNQQKVLFARWLFRRPRLLIADEPTRGVDVGAKRAIYELIHALAAEGMAILLISSEHEEVLGLAHRILVLRAGRVVGEFDHRSMSEEAVLHAAFATEIGNPVRT
jgi:simple sugar transport system ATP-binding protein/ribose transport system ATP-binding protein